VDKAGEIFLSVVAVFGGDFRLMSAREKRDEPNHIAGIYFFQALDYLIDPAYGVNGNPGLGG